ncbi:MlaD family protein [Magnetococcales bacterium HHB-1]
MVRRLENSRIGLGIALLFLAVLAWVITLTIYGHQDRIDVYLYGLLGLWGLLCFESLLSLIFLRGKKIYWHRLLAPIILPPLRLSRRSLTASDEVMFLFAGRQKISDTLRERLDRRCEWPMLGAALLIIPLLSIELFNPELIEEQNLNSDLFMALGALVWFAFALELLVKVSVAEHLGIFAWRHALDILIVLAPFLAFLRGTRLIHALRALRLFRALSRIDTYIIDRALGLITVVVVVGGTFLVVDFVLYRDHEFERADFTTTLPSNAPVTQGTPITLAGFPLGEVTSTHPLADGQMTVAYDIESDYRHLLTAESYLKLNDRIGLGALLGTTELQLIPGNAKEILPEGSSIPTDATTTVERLKKVFSTEQLATRFATILENANGILTETARLSDIFGAADNPVVAILKDLEQISTHIAHTTEKLPEVTQSMDHDLQILANALGSVETLLASIKKDVAGITHATANSMGLLDQRLARLGVLMKQVDGVLKTLDHQTNALPGILRDTRDTVENSAKMVDHLNQHPLIDGEHRRTRPGQTIHP